MTREDAIELAQELLDAAPALISEEHIRIGDAMEKGLKALIREPYSPAPRIIVDRNCPKGSFYQVRYGQ